MQASTLRIHPFKSYAVERESTALPFQSSSFLGSDVEKRLPTLLADGVFGMEEDKHSLSNIFCIQTSNSLGCSGAIGPAPQAEIPLFGSSGAALTSMESRSGAVENSYNFSSFKNLSTSSGFPRHNSSTIFPRTRPICLRRDAARPTQHNRCQLTEGGRSRERTRSARNYLPWVKAFILWQIAAFCSQTSMRMVHSCYDKICRLVAVPSY